MVEGAVTGVGRCRWAAVLAVMLAASGAVSAAEKQTAVRPERTDTVGTSAAIVALHARATALLAQDDPAGARRALEEGIDRAAADRREDLAAAPLNTLGNLLIESGERLAAIGAFSDGLRVVAPTDTSLRATLAINQARAVQLTLGQAPVGWLDEAAGHVQAIPDVSERAVYLVALGNLSELGGDSAVAERRYAVAAELLADGDGGPALAYALGYRGRLARGAGQTEEAIDLTRQAIMVAQRSRAADPLYQFQWQLATLYRERNKNADALALYAAALDSLDSVRSTIREASNAEFEQRIRPLYYEYADALLTLPPVPELDRVRRVMEDARLAELENYFRDECASVDWTLDNLAALDTSVAILYPVVLDDRIELLVGHGGQLERLTVPVSEEAVRATVRRFRLAVQYLEPESSVQTAGERVYQWLIAPLEELLGRWHVETLVIVPDTALRDAPIAAVYDGEGYLAERFALALTPGLTLTDPRPLNRKQLRVSAYGISRAVLGFDALPYVDDELEGVAAAFPTSVHLDAAFDAPALAASIADPRNTVVHIATHGEFARTYDGSYLVTYDNLLGMHDLESMIGRRRYGNDPIELLVLSACRTAQGDERAALGLAGIAVQAGARSAVASLWQVSDEATARFMTAFYQALDDPSLGRAQALRKAQRTLGADPRFGHPGYWSPFLLIGNWM